MPGRTRRAEDDSPGPWADWREKDRGKRAVRFIETYCRLPKGYGAGGKLRLAEFQRAWLRRVLRPEVSSAVMAVPRGNGKSTLLAAVATWALFDPDESGSPQVPIVATTVGQAVRSVYAVALQMIAAEPELETRSLTYTAIGATRVGVPRTGGEMFPVANHIAHLQGLDPSLAVVDEVGFMPLDAWNSLLMAGVKRPRSLVVGIGTPGFDRDNALWHLRSLHREGAVLPGFEFTEYAAPDGCRVDDEDMWRRANPALAGGYLNVEVMRTNLALNRGVEGRFRIFHLGQWVDGIECWLGADGCSVWDGLEDRWEFVGGAPTWVGVDAARTKDSTAVARVQRRPDGRLHVKWRIWLPEADRPTDPTDVMQHLRDLDAAFDVRAVSYDPRFFDVPAKILEDEGLAMIEIPQSLERMTPAVGSTYEAIGRGELSHDGDLAATVQVLAAVPRFNDRGFTLAKGKSRGKIDAAVAMCLAVDRVLRQDETPAEPQVFVA